MVKNFPFWDKVPYIAEKLSQLTRDWHCPKGVERPKNFENFVADDLIVEEK